MTRNVKDGKQLPSGVAFVWIQTQILWIEFRMHKKPHLG